MYRNFHDVIHDWEHSQRVAANARLIADSIGYKDKDFLSLAALWHDTARTLGTVLGHEEESAQLAKDDLLQHGGNEKDSQKLYEAIRFHKSSASPVTIEGKIIRDADKLDIFTIERWKKCDEKGWTNEYADDIRKTVTTISKYPKAFTYEFTKEEFKKRTPSFLEYYSSVKNKLP